MYDMYIYMYAIFSLKLFQAEYHLGSCHVHALSRPRDALFGPKMNPRRHANSHTVFNRKTGAYSDYTVTLVTKYSIYALIKIHR